MSLYEHVFIARQDVSSAQVDAIIEELKTLIENNGGKVLLVENWGLKSLAYRRSCCRAARNVATVTVGIAVTAEIAATEAIVETGATAASGATVTTAARRS